MNEEIWERAVTKALEACAACGVPLKPGEEYVATVVATPEGFVRQDRCVSCAVVQRDNVWSFWRGKRPAAKPGAPMRLDFDSLLELLRRLDGRDDASSARLRWIVTILLLRRRRHPAVRRLSDRVGDPSTARTALRLVEPEPDVVGRVVLREGRRERRYRRGLGRDVVCLAHGGGKQSTAPRSVQSFHVFEAAPHRNLRAHGHVAPRNEHAREPPVVEGLRTFRRGALGRPRQ